MGHEQISDNARKLVANLLEGAIDTAGISEIQQPTRCRAIVISPDGTEILTIFRIKPGVEPYSVLPGGGIDKVDASPLAAVRREINEELSVNPDDIDFTGTKAIAHGDQWIYVGIANQRFDGFVVGGPEVERDESVSGKYEPAWLKISDVDEANLVPAELRDLIASSYDR